MNCECIQRHVGAYVDGELDAATVVAIDAHASECEECQERIAFERTSRTLIRQSLEVEVPEGLGARMRQLLMQERGDECNHIEQHAGAYVDGELDTSIAAFIDAHIAGCEPCRERLMFERASRALIRQGLKVDVPAGLEERMRFVLADRKAFSASNPEQSSKSPQTQLNQVEQGQPPETLEPGTTHWLAITPRVALVSAAAAAMIFIGASFHASSVAEEQAAAEDVVRLHTAELPADVAVNEPGEVNEFFNGRVDFPVQPASFERDPVRLVGARMSNVRERPAAMLFYDLNGHRVTVVVTDAEVGAESADNRVAYRVVNGRRVPVRGKGGLNYVFTGDVDDATLLRLARDARVP